MVRSRHALLDLFFPPSCPSCRTRVAQAHALCPVCTEALPKAPEHHCVRCGTQTALPESGCAGCLNDPYARDATYFGFEYQGLIAELIIGCKFGDRSERSVLLGGLLWERLGRELLWESPDLVIPMPLHLLRLLKRRYNQSALIAGELAQRLQRPLMTGLLVRSKRTLPQTRLDARSRRRNVQGAFQVRGEGVRGRSVLLVDDVMTTGATLGAATLALKRAGAGRVIGVCVARVDPDKDFK
ncbi:MAG: ComF family protein [Magnetococcales bacterium]|nr:ComF family protein [Magnetococcales bacterium]